MLQFSPKGITGGWCHNIPALHKLHQSSTMAIAVCSLLFLPLFSPPRELCVHNISPPSYCLQQ